MANNFRCLLGVVGLITLFNLVVSEDIQPKVLQCVSCQGRLSLLDCDQIQTCEHEDEICYVEEVIDLGGQIVINAGCRKQHDCDSRGCFNDVTRKKRDVAVPRPRRSSTGEEICHHCCDTTLCNMYGCSNTDDMDNLKGSRCVACDVTEHPSRCSFIHTCDAGQMCLTTMMVRNTGATMEKRYKTGCMKDEVCAVLDKIHNEHEKADLRKKRAFVDVYSECCKDHMCNRDIPLATEPPQRQSKKYTCPDRNTTAVTDSNPDETVSICEDKIDNCAEYGEEYICHGDYIPWAKLNCNKFCKFCEPCEDKIAECSEYGFEYICHGDYIPWSLLNCRHFCNLCAVTTPAPATTMAVTTVPTTADPNVCEDENDECPLYGSDYICHGDYIPWSLLNCKKFCNLCNYVETTSVSTIQASTTTEKYVCRDKVDNCAEYGREYICVGDYIPWSQINCRVFCGLCSETSPATTVPATTVPATTVPATTDPATTKAITTKDPDVCEDKTDDCPLYGSDYICQGDYIPWSLLNCKKFCNLCSYVETSPNSTIQAVCHDMIDYCADYGSEYICFGDYIPWSQINCPVFCGLCAVETTTKLTTLGQTTEQATSPTTTPIQTTEAITTVPSTTPKPVHSTSTRATTTTENVCIDRIDNCAEYGREYICIGDYIPWAKINCPVFCGICTATTTTENYVCRDRIYNCAEYGSEYICIGDYIPWSQINCPIFCGFCTAETTTKLTTLEQTTEQATSPTTTPIQTTDAITTVPSTTSKPVHSIPTKGTPSVTSTELPTTSPQTPESTTDIPVTATIVTTVPSTNATAKVTSEHGMTSSLPTTKVTTYRVTSTLVPKTTSNHEVASSSSKPTTKQAVVETDPTTKVTTSEVTSTLAPKTTTKQAVIETDPTTKVATTKTASTLAPQTTERVTTDPEIPCRDTLDCSVYSVKLACHGDFLSWAYEHCPKYCGFCTDESDTTTTMKTTTASSTTRTTTPPTTTVTTTTTQAPSTTPEDPNCRDMAHCVGLEHKCDDPTEHHWLYENCRHTCDMCNEAADCEDEIHDCAALAVLVCEMGLNPELKPKCKKTCQLC